MLEITDGAVLMLALLVFFDAEGLLPVFLSAAALHELGHVLALRLTGGSLRRLRITALGGRLDCRLPEGRARCFAVHAAGAAANFAAVLPLRAAGCPLFAGANLVLGCFNLLPVCPLDGFACLEALTEGRWTPLRLTVSLALAVLFTGAGFWLFRSGMGVSLAAAGAFLLTVSCKNLRSGIP